MHVIPTQKIKLHTKCVLCAYIPKTIQLFSEMRKG